MAEDIRTGGQHDRARLAILLSGRGSNFVTLADACKRGEVPADVVLVISNKADAPGLERARERGIPTLVLPTKGVTRDEHEGRMMTSIREAKVNWVCLTGYMRILSPVFINAFPERILNIHPALLPAFPGLEAQHQAFDYGVKVSGCTVHFVDAGCDTGPIVLQRTVAVREDDTANTLAERILKEEHIAYAAALRMLLTRDWHIAARRVVFSEFS